MTIKALVASNDHDEQSCWSDILRDLGVEVRVAATQSSVLTALGEGDVHLLLMSDRLLQPGGLGRLESFAHAEAGPEIVVVTDRELGTESLHSAGPLAVTCFRRSSGPTDFEQMIESLAQKQELSFQNRLLREQLATRQGLGALVGTSAKMQKVYERIMKVASQRHSLLVLGESGTGKELVARAIHAYGPWQHEPFVPIDCGALSSHLIESELFGHVRGAFTGANQNRKGLLATAGRGTVFLDEIGELPVELQAKLLRALQEREIRPVGSNQHLPLEARIMAGTNQHLEGAVTRGTFRKDLFFRLNVVSIKLPPLRERKSDIPALAYHFIDRFGKGSGETTGISYEAMTRLMSYDWPGNVRELENCIQRAMTLGSGPEVQVQDLPSNLLYGLAAEPAPRQITTLQELERRAILDALEATGGDRLRAAQLLGIGKTTIYRKVKEYGLDDAVPPHALT